jgi:hypothetical protein
VGGHCYLILQYLELDTKPVRLRQSFYVRIHRECSLSYGPPEGMRCFSSPTG